MPLKQPLRGFRCALFVAGVATVCLCLTPLWASAQGSPASPPAQPTSAVPGVEPSGDSATVMFSNRPIAVLHARLMGRSPSGRAEVTTRLLDDLVSRGITGPIEVRTLDGSSVISVGGRTVMALTALDVDPIAGDTLSAETERTVSALRLALAEALEARSPSLLLRAGVSSLLALGIATVLLLAIGRGHHRIASRLIAAAEGRVARAGAGSLDVLRAARVFDFWRSLVSLVSITLGLVIAYSALTFILRRFPYTRPWGESMRSFMFASVSTLGFDMVHAIPSLFTVFLIVLIVRFFIRILRLFFRAVEQDNVHVPWLHPETAQPTRRIATTLLWIFAAVMAYPYLPGSGTDAFKGASVFIGLILSLGSSGLVNQVMSSFMITYSRSFRLGDYVRVGEVEGTVVHVGMLSTKLKTKRREEVTIPNAVVVTTTATNYSRFAGDGVYVQTSVRIGYDTPWRQVESLLQMAAARTPGIRQDPPPKVRQAGLHDFHVRYALLVSLDRPEGRGSVMSALHANILDVFNEYGVQIMSPHYEVDPEEPKVVPQNKWHASPAQSVVAGSAADSAKI
jgi:small-conductance mechanosensitive channel